VASFYRGATAMVIVFDLTQPESFMSCTRWADDIKKFSFPGIPVLLIGNKADLENARRIDSDIAEEFAAKHGFTYAPP